MPLPTDLLSCPRCAPEAPLHTEGAVVVCPTGHTFDIARQGYVNLLTRTGLLADDAAMVAARLHVLTGGVYAPIVDELTGLVAELAPRLPDGALLDVGGGPGFYAARVLDVLPDRRGVCLDLSVYAARRAARVHPRLGAVVADAWSDLPVRSGRIGLVLTVFAPRHVPEFARVLAPGGVALVLTPEPDHLVELVTELDLPRVDPRKQERLADRFAGWASGPTRHVRTTIAVPGGTAAQIVAMGPGAHHVDPDRLAVVARTPQRLTLAVRLAAYSLPSSTQ